MQISVHDITKEYQKNRGLFSVSFTAEKGECIAIVGHNGAGKSTLLKILSGWIIPDSGQATVDGVGINNRLALVRNVGFVPETPSLFESFSVEYNLRLFARLFQIPLSRVTDILNEFNLLPFRKNNIQALSKGIKQKVSIGRSLLPEPQVILLDEPTAGLDFEATKEVYQLLTNSNAAGKTVLFTSHRPGEIRTLASRIIVLHQGKIVFDGMPAQYFQSQVHKELYV